MLLLSSATTSLSPMSHIIIQSNLFWGGWRPREGLNSHSNNSRNGKFRSYQLPTTTHHFFANKDIVSWLLPPASLYSSPQSPTSSATLRFQHCYSFCVLFHAFQVAWIHQYTCLLPLARAATHHTYFMSSSAVISHQPSLLLLLSTTTLHPSCCWCIDPIICSTFQ